MPYREKAGMKWRAEILLWACDAPREAFQRRELDGVPASLQKCQAEGIGGINLNTCEGCIPRRRADVITCFLIIHMQTDVRAAVPTVGVETAPACNNAVPRSRRDDSSPPSPSTLLWLLYAHPGLF